MKLSPFTLQSSTDGAPVIGLFMTTAHTASFKQATWFYKNDTRGKISAETATRLTDSLESRKLINYFVLSTSFSTLTICISLSLKPFNS